MDEAPHDYAYSEYKKNAGTAIASNTQNSHFTISKSVTGCFLYF